MMPTCTATKRDGTPCTLASTGPDGLCWVHTPENAAKRRRGQSRGGKGSRELSDLKRRILDTVEGVLAGTLDRGRAAVAVQGYNALRAALELERKIKETDEIEARLEALEALDAQQSRIGPYGRA